VARRIGASVIAALLLAPAATAVAAPISPSFDGPYGTSQWVNTTVEITTDFGVIVGMLYDEGAPITTSNFVNLSTSGFYDGIRFHRIVDDFVIQTGDPNTKDGNPYNDGSGGSSQTIPLETNESLTHEDGAFGMARSNDPNSASSQFYICDGPQPGLDGNYAVFGIVIAGIDVVREIASQPVNGLRRPLLQEQPVNDITMQSVVVTHGYWNNTTGSGGGAGGGGSLFSFGPGGSGPAVVLALLVALLAAVWLVPPLRTRAFAVARKLPALSGAARRVKGLVPRRKPR
jgi:peptidyl-prolyl cis-trans isomerase B (cyclophilin B)